MITIAGYVCVCVYLCASFLFDLMLIHQLICDRSHLKYRFVRSVLGLSISQFSFICYVEPILCAVVDGVVAVAMHHHLSIGIDQ